LSDTDENSRASKAWQAAMASLKAMDGKQI
jgi:hypothetical protein